MSNNISLLTAKTAELFKDFAASGKINLTGLPQAASPFMLLALKEHYKIAGPPVLIVANELRARKAALDFRALTGKEGIILRKRTAALADAESAGRETEMHRLAVLCRMQQSDSPPIVVTADALSDKLPAPEITAQRVLYLNTGMRFAPDKLAERLTANGYERVQMVEGPGSFAQRGEIVDIGLADTTGRERVKTARVSYFDDEIEQLRFFDPASQRSIEIVRQIYIPPAREVLLSKEKKLKLADEIRKLGQAKAEELIAGTGDRGLSEKILRISERDAERLENNIDFAGIDRWLPLTDNNFGIIDYLNAVNACTALENVAEIQNSIIGSSAEFLSEVTNLLEKGYLTSISEEMRFDSAETMRRLLKAGRILEEGEAIPKRLLFSFADLKTAGSGLAKAEEYNLRLQSSESYTSRTNDLLEDLDRFRREGYYTLLYCNTEERKQGLKKLLQEKHITLDERLTLAEDSIEDGFSIPAAGVVILAAENIFGKKRKVKRKKHSGQQVDFYGELKEGDYVVHDDYGIGIYNGIISRETDRGMKDYLYIQYSGHDELFLPIESVSSLQKYIAAGERKPALSRLGGNDWSKRRQKAGESVKKLAVDLLALYAKRRTLTGHAFSPDTDWQRSFENDFPYEETPDQLKAIEEIKADMESEKVMDRLLCGDVGFGKTEIAFRAMFKAVMDGYQAIMLVPTTVLAKQHYDSLKDRVKKYGVELRLLSRFVKDEEAADTIKGLKSGTVDIVIATHRILGDKIKIKKPGLLVVDEEQRFGVNHKEKIKDRYEGVDVLTLTATPIPRTLHMSLTGIRDFSVLSEGPADRRPVQTYVCEYDEEIFKEALLREIGRNGQAFYLYNDTKGIYQKAAEIQEWLPGIRVSTGHARMGEEELEDVINDFVNHESDVLVCTTIIESGIDMPNVNTIIIENADRFGLSQLYQIKGRVGRSGRRAYAYISYDGNKELNENAVKRLRAIKDFTELGSGFKIAMRDLEVRGAGNLLGGEQHGHMEAVGYDLYVRMLDETVKRLKKNYKDKLAERKNAVETCQGRIKPLPKTSESGVDAKVLAAGIEGMNDFESSLIKESIEAANLDLSQMFSPKKETLVDLQLEAVLPADYIEGSSERMEIYKKILAIENIEDYRDLLDEIIDRFGEPPAAALALLDISYVRRRSGLLKMEKVEADGKNVVMSFYTDYVLPLEKLALLLDSKTFKDKLLFKAGRNPELVFMGANKQKHRSAALLRRLFTEAEEAEKAYRAEKNQGEDTED